MKKIKVCLYMRYSSQAQNDGFSIEAQDKALTQYCLMNGYEIVEKYIDRACTGTNDRREEFQRMLEDSKTGKFQKVLVHKTDRFSRNRLDALLYRRELELRSVELVSITENFGEGPQAELMKGIQESFSEFYSQNLGSEVRKGLNVVASNGLHTGGSPPLGYYVGEDRKLAINEEEAKIVRTIFEQYASGGTYNSIAKELNLKKYKTRAGKDFSASSMTSILHNRKYIGEYTYNLRASKDYAGRINSHKQKPEEEVIRIPNGVPRIIDDETFNKVQRRLEKNKNRTQAYKPSSSYLLTGLVECGECGFRYQGNSRKSGGKNKSIYSSYRCGKTQNNKGGCNNGEIEKNRLENFVIEQLQRHLFTPSAITKITELVNKHNKEVAENKDITLIQYESSLKDVEKQIKNLVDSIAMGVPQDMLAEKMSSLQDTKNELEARIKGCSSKFVADVKEEDVKKAVQKFSQYLKENNTAEVKAFLNTYIEKIVINKDNVEVVFKICSEEYNQEALEEESAKILVDVEISREELANQPKQKRKISASAIDDSFLKEITISE